MSRDVFLEEPFAERFYGRRPVTAEGRTAQPSVGAELDDVVFTGKFVKSLTKPEADSLENLLIYNCLRANQRLLNISGTSFFKEARIPGLLNNPKGAPLAGASFPRRLLNLE